MDQGVADVVALEEGREDGSGRKRPVGRDVLDAVDREVGLAGEERGVDLLGEGALALHLRQVAHPLVAGGPHRQDGRLHVRVERGQLGADTLHLGECHGRIAGHDANQITGHEGTIDPQILAATTSPEAQFVGVACRLGTSGSRSRKLPTRGRWSSGQGRERVRRIGVQVPPSTSCGRGPAQPVERLISHCWGRPRPGR